MMEFFREAATKIMHPSIEEWIKSGKRVIGYTCSFLPPEILYAADILPYRLRGIETESMEIGDTYYGPFICTFPKCLLQLAGEGKFKFMDGAIISTGCDAMRRLDDCWRKAGTDYKGIVPDFFHYFDVPHKTDPHAMQWFVDEIHKVIKKIESDFNISITAEKLKEAIETYNRGRELLAELDVLRASNNVLISGTDAFSIVVASTVLPRDLFNEKLAALISSLKEDNKSIGNGKKRIMVAGSISDDIELVELIEDAGSVVVAENICFGIRGQFDQVSLEGDPVESLAQRYLSDSVCPRMFGAYDQRFNFLKEKAETTSVQGVIFQNVRFCDMHGSENSLFERDFEKMGIPCLRLEREYGPLVETGRMQMRIDAFLEQI